MKFDPNTESDFLKNPLFLKWIKTPNAELDRFWQAWGKKHPEKAPMMLRAKELSKSLRWKNKYSMDEQDYDKMLDNLILFNAKYEHQHKIKNIHGTGEAGRLKWWWAAAASLLLLGFLSLRYFEPVGDSNDDEPEIIWITKAAAKGVKKIVHLPDGSEVTLNSDSEIRYPSSFETERTVELNGQAFFDVVKNPELPFMVRSGELKTTVLGTSFDISAYPQDQEFHVAVVTGKVKVDTENGVTAMITPDEATFYDTEKRSLTKGTYDYNHLIGWKERVLKFQEEPYARVFERLSRWYNISFDFNNGTVFPGKYSGEFKNESLENVLKGMQYSLGFDYVIKDGKVKINQK
ncbi:FecR domain-containing protein [Echinicola marina]|uniref:FecR family protein n=1 Tax=Echinicola marina TaxID=2859768 RepID=UPI001CF6A881|nr:FecR family protein [Echinicola marina]UCS91801.1 FecR domain-containing protein [Echinicola marina]